MVRRTISLSLLAAFLLLIPTSFAAARLDGVFPLTMLPPNTSVSAGETVHFTVMLSGPATGNEVIDIDVSAGAFSSIPSTVTPYQGNSYVTVTGTLSQTPGSLVVVEASTEDATVGTMMAIADEAQNSSGK